MDLAGFCNTSDLSNTESGKQFVSVSCDPYSISRILNESGESSQNKVSTNSSNEQLGQIFLSAENEIPHSNKQDSGLDSIEVNDNSVLRFPSNNLNTLQSIYQTVTEQDHLSNNKNFSRHTTMTLKDDMTIFDTDRYLLKLEASHTNVDSAVARCFSTPKVTEKLQFESKTGSFVRPKRKTMNLGKKLGPPQRVKINEDPEEKRSHEVNEEPYRLKTSDRKDQILPQKIKKSVSFNVNSSNEIKEIDKNDRPECQLRGNSLIYQKENDKKNFIKESTSENHGNQLLIQPHHRAWLNETSYNILERIGRGGSSKVYKVSDSNGQIYALKKVSFRGVDQQAISGYISEIELLKKLAGRKGIIKLYDSEINREQGYLLMLMECGDIDFAHLLNNQSDKPIKIDFIRSYWRQMLEAVYTIHLEKIIHSDLKPANFIVNGDNLKLIDFGIAKTIPNDTTNIHREQQVGTINYMSPEAILDTNSSSGAGRKLMKLGRPSDVWSLGCILYQMVYGKPPFSHLSMIQKIKCITDFNYQIDFPPTTSLITKYYNSQDERMSKQNIDVQTVPVDEKLLKIMKSCLQRNPKERMTIPALLTDPFLNDSLESISPPILDCLLREVIKYTQKTNITQNSHEKITEITKAIFTQLRNKESINCEKWDNL
ncbi:3872_t:CDS:10 [Diversispora eburnea]|uniref:3872_t:CDS:1 n=1 Tax=Diversispora eburnea TaxID=1213867 RepID=A0A9N8VUA0_9GLOM|nr:3872_t:CDS:10 [Diversispora eburnea]